MFREAKLLLTEIKRLGNPCRRHPKIHVADLKIQGLPSHYFQKKGLLSPGY